MLGIVGFLMAVAVTVDYHRVVDYLFSDEAVYYMMAESIVYDRDLEYTPQDLQRVYEEGWYAGPQGVFLTKLTDGRIVYSKSFVFALFLAPFLAVFGFHGFLILNMLLLFLMIWMGWAYLRQFNGSQISLMLSLTFFLLSASFLYTFWLAPETFNMFCITAGLFLWIYERDEGGDAGASGMSRSSFRRTCAPLRFVRWLVATPEGRLFLAPVPIAIAGASKLPNILFIFPIVADIVFEGYTALVHTHTRASDENRWFWRSPAFWMSAKKFLLVTFIFVAVVGVFYGLQYVLTGHFNPYAGDRKTFHWNFPFASQGGWEDGTRLSNDDYQQTQFYFHPKSLLYNVYYYVFGRFTGVLPYFFCALLALYYFGRSLFALPVKGRQDASALRRAKPRHDETLRRVFIVLTIGASIFAYIYKAPANYQGGGGAFGNRFFLNIYPAFLFLVTLIPGIRSLAVGWLVGSLFLAQSLVNPFQTSYYPAAHAFRFPFRLLPVELTLVDTLPTNINHHLVQTAHRQDPPYRLYFADEYVYDISTQGFWVQGERRTDMVLRTYEPEPEPYLAVTITNGLVANQVDVTVAGQTRTVHFTRPRGRRHLVFSLDWSLPYFQSRLYPVSIRSHNGFIPKFTPGTGRDDIRYLGCRARLSFEPLTVGEALVENGHVDAAIALLEPVVEKSRKNMAVCAVLANAYQQNGQLGDAMNVLEHSIALLPYFQEEMLEACEEQGESCVSELMASTFLSGLHLDSADRRHVEATEERGRHKTDHLAALLAPMTRRYEAEATTGTNGGSVEQADASAGQILTFTPSQHQPGYLVYGQRAEYLPGKYQARFWMKIGQSPPQQASTRGITAYFEVFDTRLGIIAQDSVAAESEEPEGEHEFKAYTLDFDLPRAAELQFRVKTTGFSEVSADVIEVYPRLPLQLVQTAAQVKRARGAYDEALRLWQDLCSVDPWTPQYRREVLATLLDAEYWNGALAFLTQYHSLADPRTGLATLLLEAQQISGARVLDYREELLSRFSPGIVRDDEFSGTIRLLGYELSADAVHPGENVRIRYFWKSVNQIDEDYAIFVHFLKKGLLPFAHERVQLARLLRRPVTTMFQHDHYPLHGTYPTNRWLPGEMVREQYELTVPAHIEPGTYEIWLGVWNPLTNKRLQSNGDTKMKIGELEIHNP